MSQQDNKHHAFVVDSLANLLEHIAQSEDHEAGNPEIIYMLIAKELRYRAEQLLNN